MTFDDFKDVYQDAPPLEKLNLLMETLSWRADAQAISATERWNGNWKAEQFWTNEMRTASAKARWLYEELANALKAQEQEVVNLQTKVAELTTAREPRVMTLEEVKMLDSDYYYLESMRSPGKELREIVGAYGLTCVTWPSITWARQTMGDSGYRKTWRCWTSRPTDAQREATPWKKN